MTSPPTPPAKRSWNAATLLAVLGAVVIGVALLTPEAPGSSEGGRSSYSTAPGGIGIAYELAQRTGWKVQRRLEPLDSTRSAPAVQVVIDPQQALGAHEVHRLLDNARRGGALIFSLDGADEIADSLGVDTGPPGRILEGYNDPQCPDHFSFRSRALLTIPPVSRSMRMTCSLSTCSSVLSPAGCDAGDCNSDKGARSPGPLERITALSMKFSSSRTLPGHA